MLRRCCTSHQGEYMCQCRQRCNSKEMPPGIALSSSSQHVFHQAWPMWTRLCGGGTGQGGRPWAYGFAKGTAREIAITVLAVTM